MSTHDEHWAGFPSEFEGESALVTTDLGWGEEGPNAKFSTLARVRIANPSPGPDHLQDFLEAIEPFDDALTEALDGKGKGYMVAFVLTEAFREWCFYLPSEAAATALVAAASAKAPGLSASVTTDEDPSWEFYVEVLYPDDSQLRFIADDSVVQQFLEDDDDVEQPRLIEHLAIMPDPFSRDRFVKWCEENGFTVTEAADELDEEMEGFPVAFTHHGPIITDQIWEKTMAATEAADEFGGEYDGWEAAIIKKEEDQD